MSPQTVVLRSTLTRTYDVTAAFNPFTINSKKIYIPGHVLLMYCFLTVQKSFNYISASFKIIGFPHLRYVNFIGYLLSFFAS